MTTNNSQDQTIVELQRVATASPVTPQHRYIQIRSFSSEAERDRLVNNPGRWPHIRPDSILVCAIGNHWKPGSWNRVIDMIMYSQQQGLYVALQEVQDRCFNPYDALGTMRNESVLQAQLEGFEWLLMVDNDVLPERDTLIRLVAHQMPIMTPYIIEPGSGRKLFGPGWEPNQGIKPLRWTVLSMLLFQTNVFNCVGPRFWSDAVGADEGYHFMTLYKYGHRPWMDTNTVCVVADTPHYPLASNRIDAEARKILWDKINQRRAGVPDRRGYEIDTPTVDGEVQPWVEQDASIMVTSTPAIPMSDLSAAEREAMIDHMVAKYGEPPDRKPISPDQPHIIDGEYLPFVDPGTQGVPQPVGNNNQPVQPNFSWKGQ